MFSWKEIDDRMAFFFSSGRNLEKAGTASGTFYHAWLGQVLRVEVQEEKEAAGKGR